MVQTQINLTILNLFMYDEQEAINSTFELIRSVMSTQNFLVHENFIPENKISTIFNVTELNQQLHAPRSCVTALN